MYVFVSRKSAKVLVLLFILGFSSTLFGQNPNSYPDFSWEHVPLYMHMRKSKAFTDKELEYLSGFPIITFEKTTGSATYGSTEKGTLEAAKGVKALNPNAKLFYYRNVMVHYKGYDINKSLEKIDNPLLLDKDGNTVLIHGGKRGVYDLTNIELQKWWLDHCIKMLGHKEIDGIFIDGNIKALEPEFLSNIIGKDKKEEVAGAYVQMMKTLDASTPDDKLLQANLIRARLPESGLDQIKYFDGSYIEGFEIAANGYSRIEYMQRGIAAVQKAAQDGKIICFSLGLGEAARSGIGIDDTRKDLEENADIQKRLTYNLAIFLVCAEKYSYFLAHDGYSVNGDDSVVWMKLFPEYERPLGPPKGKAVKDGNIYTRDFEHASVRLDIENEKATIDWK